MIRKIEAPIALLNLFWLRHHLVCLNVYVTQIPFTCFDGKYVMIVETRAIVYLLIAIVTAISLFAMREASAVFAPAALAIFIVAIIWPFYDTLAKLMPRFAAILIVVLGTAAICALVTWLAIWSVGHVTRSIMADSLRYQEVYVKVVTWLESHDISIQSIWVTTSSPTWIFGVAQQVAGRLNTIINFLLIAIVYVMLALGEVQNLRTKLTNMEEGRRSDALISACRLTAERFRSYAIVRTNMSLLTGLLTFMFLAAFGMPMSLEWGVIAFIVNYIPFIGPLLAIVLPSALAIIYGQDISYAIYVFSGLVLIQFVTGYFIEPKVSANALSMSPLVVILTIFLWSYIWGIFGSFIGVPVAIAVLTFCSQYPETRWIASLLGGQDEGTKLA